MMLAAWQAAAVAVLGGVVALDETSLGQFMLSRPLVAATLGGLAVGRPAQGVAVGVVLEALHLAVLPVGAARYPEGGPPAVAAGALVAAQHPPVAAGATLLVAVLCALALEWLGGRSVIALRQLNVRFSGAPGGAISPGRLAARHAAPMALDFARGAALALGGALLLGWLLEWLDLSGFPALATSSVLRLAVVAGLASSLRLFGRANHPLFAAGVGAGQVVAWLS
jgi:mannose/fructose/N-acetylgalactosamine-specific phosphotransferase system component IIC